MAARAGLVTPVSDVTSHVTPADHREPPPADPIRRLGYSSSNLNTVTVTAQVPTQSLCQSRAGAHRPGPARLAESDSNSAQFNVRVS